MIVYTAEEIRKIRKELNLTQKEFAEKIGCSESTVSSWEQGRRSPVGAARSAIHQLVVQSNIKILLDL